MEPCPQAFPHGSTHLFRTHALSLGQSVFKTHSGLQPARGLPKYSGKQVQTSLSYLVLGPQGVGLNKSDSLRLVIA